MSFDGTSTGATIVLQKKSANGLTITNTNLVTSTKKGVGALPEEVCLSGSTIVYLDLSEKLYVEASGSGKVVNGVNPPQTILLITYLG
jgi:hypothetical protein